VLPSFDVSNFNSITTFGSTRQQAGPPPIDFRSPYRLPTPPLFTSMALETTRDLSANMSPLAY